MDIVAVGMQDVKQMGVDRFYVRFEPNVVHAFDVFADGHVTQLTQAPLPEAYVTASIEKFNASFRVVPPLAVNGPADLPGFLGKFEVVDATSCRHRP
jgi:hypothetical protein